MVSDEYVLFQHYDNIRQAATTLRDLFKPEFLSILEISDEAKARLVQSALDILNILDFTTLV